MAGCHFDHRVIDAPALTNWKRGEVARSAIENAERNGWPWHARSARLGWSYALRQDDKPEEAERVLQPLLPESEHGIPAHNDAAC